MSLLHDTLRQLIVQNNYRGFFQYWKEKVASSSPLHHQASQLEATWNKLEDDEIGGLLSGSEAGIRRARLTDGLLRLTDQLYSAHPATTHPNSSNTTPNPIQELLQRKLAALRRERVLATDASVKFKLDLEIEEIEKQLP